MLTKIAHAVQATGLITSAFLTGAGKYKTAAEIGILFGVIAALFMAQDVYRTLR